MKKIVFNLLIIICLFSCQKEKITIGTDAHDVFFLRENGSSLPIQVHGNTASKKILVTLHGGPGGSSFSFREDDYVRNNLEKEFAVAYWDQRFAGASQGSTSNSDIPSFKSDLKKVLQLLKSRYGNDTKLYLMGHSWGGFLAPYFLIDGSNQDLLKGWIQVDGAHNYTKADSLTKEMMLFYGKREIAANRNTQEWQEIVNFFNAHAYNESRDVSLQFTKYSARAQGYFLPSSTKLNLGGGIGDLQSSKFPVTASVSNYIISSSILKIDSQATSIPISENLYKIKLPTLLLWGRYDFNCPLGLKDDIKKNIRSTDVSEKIFENSGHAPMLDESVSFWSAVVNWVKVH
jgi:pimeloyl-ACP methyl ester carboxylesterase